MIQYGEADLAIAGGTESVMTPLAVGGFGVMKALSTRNDDPLHASRPWDRDRDGFVIAEGAGLVILEEMEAAKKRGARIYAELVGYGLSGDAYHIAAPSEDGDGPARVMKNCLADAGLNPEQIDYINAHGTSTPLGDKAETIAIKKVFGEHAKEAGRLLDEVHDRAPARRGRRARDGDLRAGGPPRRAPAHDQLRESRSRVRPRLRAEHGAAREGPVRALELLRLRRHQRLPHPEEDGLSHA